MLLNPHRVQSADEALLSGAGSLMRRITSALASKQLPVDLAAFTSARFASSKLLLGKGGGGFPRLLAPQATWLIVTSKRHAEVLVEGPVLSFVIG